jgi:hypothetical protein
MIIYRKYHQKNELACKNYIEVWIASVSHLCLHMSRLDATD